MVLHVVVYSCHILSYRDESLAIEDNVRENLQFHCRTQGLASDRVRPVAANEAPGLQTIPVIKRSSELF